MNEPRRRALPDNLDPLVDTLFNVVGILVFIVALTQLQLGDALERLIEMDAFAADHAARAARSEAAQIQRRTQLESRLDELATTRANLLARSSGDLADGLAEIDWALAELDRLPRERSQNAARDLAALEKAIRRARREEESQRTALEQRSRYRDELTSVPRELVARLPDPAVVRGAEQWILCRYGRCFLTDRRALVEIGSRAVGRVLHHNRIESIRPDEFESLAHHFRKREVGIGNFRWKIVTEARPRARLVWRSKDAGLDRGQIESSGQIQSWLAARSPDRDFIRFQVWSDSFEAYLAAREAIEAAGFRAGWRGHEVDQEFDLQLTFDRPRPSEGPVEVD